jgi:hypothetical protein
MRAVGPSASHFPSASAAVAGDDDVPVEGPTGEDSFFASSLRELEDAHALSREGVYALSLEDVDALW